MAHYRLGLDGLPVVYRFRAEAGEKYVVYLASTPHIGGFWLESPKKSGDLVFEYQVEGCQPKTLDWWDYIHAKSQPLCVGFEGATDRDGDGFIEVRSGVAAASRIKHTRLSAIYVFPEGTKVKDLESVYSGARNGECVWHIDVGATPEQESQNQLYDASDVGLARLKLHYGESIAPGETKTFWLRVPAIHRRQPASMGYIAHAFRDVLSGEAVPPCAGETLAALAAASPQRMEQTVRNFWASFFARAAKFKVPDPILEDIYLSRLATRAILDVNLGKQLSFNVCSPFFYFDHAYRDQAYVIYAFDLAGMHAEAENLLRVYCRDVPDVPKGPIAFDGKPLQLGMLANGLWNTRPGQWDTQGENIWALVQHYKLSGDRAWLEQTAYPYVRRGALWLVNSRHQAHGGGKGSGRRSLRFAGAWRDGGHRGRQGDAHVLSQRLCHPRAARGRRRRASLGPRRRRPPLRRGMPRPEAMPAPLLPADLQADGPLRGASVLRRRAGGRGDVRLLGPQLPALAVPQHRSARPDGRRDLAVHGDDEQPVGRRNAR